jgi:hypothetical protein
MSWNWSAASTYPGKVPWEFQQLRFDKQPSREEFDSLLAAPPGNLAQRWVLVEPPGRIEVGQNNQTKAPPALAGASFATSPAFVLPTWFLLDNSASLLGPAIRDELASDFVRRLVSAKVRRADAIVVTSPFNNENGLMRANGMPAEFLLPWRTTAAMLGGAEYLGDLQLPSGSQNRIFRRPDGQVVMVVWNTHPSREALFLGNDVRSIDIFGRTTKVPLNRLAHEHVIHVGPTPTFILGLHEAITRLRMSVAFESNQVPSIFSKPHHNSLRFKNFFPQGEGGSVKLVVLEHRQADLRSGEQNPLASSVFLPDSWTIEPPQRAFQLAANEEMEFPFDIKLKNALFGKQPVRVDFKVEADETYQFSVYHQMEVGTEDLTLDVRSRLDKDGTLIVEQLMTNRAKRLADFKCYLRARGYRPQRMQVYRLGPNLDRKVYRFPDGRALIGREMLLELEEINGARVLRYRFVATAESLSVEQPDDDDAQRAAPAPDNAKQAAPLSRVGP